MKHKNTVFAAMALSLTLLLAGCGPEKAGSPSPAEKGEELVALLNEMINSHEYMEAFSGSTAIGELISSAAAGDFSEPETVYAVTVPEEALLRLAGEPEGLSPDAQRLALSRIFASIPGHLNAMDGAEVLAASSLCSTGSSFLCPELAENILYIYIYKNAAPAAVTLIKGEDGTVSATATLILSPGFPAGNPEEIAGLLSDYSALVSPLPDPEA